MIQTYGGCAKATPLFVGALRNFEEAVPGHRYAIEETTSVSSLSFCYNNLGYPERSPKMLQRLIARNTQILPANYALEGTMRSTLGSTRAAP
jgi:hypothetical protein